MDNAIAIITARGGSRRIPKKNIKMFCGKPIIAYSIEAAFRSGIFSEVMVSTDSEEIAEIAREYGASVPFMRSAQTADEETEGSTESERRPVPEHPVSGTTPPQTSDPQQKKDESERRSETTASPAPSETEQPIPPATEEPKPSEPPQPTQPSMEPPTEPSFDIGYWVNFAKSYAESVGLTLDSGAAYCWDNPIAAGSKCRYTERDIRGYLDRYAKDSDITEVWVWYEQTSGNSYEVYIGYA